MKRFLFLIVTLSLINAVFGQNTYKMGNYKVYDCKGKFTDSDAGLKTGDYDHNESFIFTICVPGGDYVTLTFSQFCTEKDLDYLQFYDGRDTNASKIGPRYSGTSNPGTISSTDSCLTIYFKSDKSVACSGWEANWTTKVLPLPNPKFVAKPQVSCSTSVLRVRLDQKFLCDSINDSTFRLSGQFAPSVTKVIPIGCSPSGMTDSFELLLSGGINRGGTYTINFRAVKYDICDSAWVLTAAVSFSVTDCPIYVDLDANPDTICIGGCSFITAIVTGGDSTKYIYNWNNGLPSVKGPQKVCPLVTTKYTLTVSDGVAVPGTDSVTVYVLPKPKAPNDTTVCQSSGAFILSATPPGGTWKGKGITNPTTGNYNPPTAGAGNDVVVYFSNGCSDTMNINVRGISAGGTTAACPGGASFLMTGFTPAGGFWTGPHIDSSGLFTPDTSGVFIVKYNWNGCVANKTVNIKPISVQADDTVCLSAGDITLGFSPTGGVWSGTGIVNSVLGIFRTTTAGIGNKTLVYNMNGCRDTVLMRVENINAGVNQTICLSQAAFTLPAGSPAGGYWKGKGIADTATGLYDPALFGKVANDTLTYFSNGCSAKKVMFVRTVIVAKKTMGLCIEQPALVLNNATVQNSPNGGTWTGPGVSGGFFTASVAGYGTHKLTYNFNTCTDSTFFTVYPKSIIQKDTTFCQTDPQFTLYNGQVGGYFKGKGIIDTAKGIFRPLTAGVGNHLINYFSANGCKDSLRITVTALPVVNLSGLNPFYCLKDTFDGLVGSPAGGSYWGKGVSGNTFNPKDAGSGTHKAYYQFGTPTCYRIDSVTTIIGDTLRVKAVSDRDTICLGENVQLSAMGSGGQFFDYTFLWSDGQQNKVIFQSPVSSGNYWVTIGDGCSDDATDSVYILVNPKVAAQIQTSPIACYGQMGFAEVIPGTGDSYQVNWHTSPPVSSLRVNAPVANKYFVDILNLTTGCRLDTFAVIPGYGKIQAYFVTVPDGEICLSPFDPVVNIINYSQGADTGTWYFGDGSRLSYDPFTNPLHRYAADTTHYRIKLVVGILSSFLNVPPNGMACMDSMEADVCLNDSVYVLVPTAFTPDGNNRNEIFKPVVAGAKEYEFLIYNRWGEKVFHTTNIDAGWDGNYLGNPCQNGVYVYLISYKGRKTVTKLEKGTVLLLR